MGLSSLFGNNNEISKYEGVVNLGQASGNAPDEVSLFVMPPLSQEGEIIVIDKADFDEWKGAANIVAMEHLSEPLQEMTQASAARQGAEAVLANYDMHVGSRPSFIKDDGIGPAVREVTAQDLPEVVEALIGITNELHHLGGQRVDNVGHEIPASMEHLEAGVRINEIDPVLSNAIFASRIEDYRNSLEAELPSSDFSPEEQADIIDIMHKIMPDDQALSPQVPGQ